MNTFENRISFGGAVFIFVTLANYKGRQFRQAIAMKIAQIAPIIERIPPKKYGGTERVIYDLTEELVKRGHDVTLFATGDSITSAKLVSVVPKSLREIKAKDMYGANPSSLLHSGFAYQMQDQFDIIHDQNIYLNLPLANVSKTPVVATLHGPFTSDNRQMFRRLRNPFLVSISNAQRMPEPNLHYAGTVYNGENFDGFPFEEKHDGYLLFVGRISMEKGVHHAIEAALYMNLPLIIAAKLDKIDVPYFKEYVEPELSEQIEWIGEVDAKKRNELFSQALCSLHPVTWREPFGLTIIEAQACGCPVVAFGRGSIPELIIHGKTGFVVSQIEEMMDAIARIDEIDRAECRRHALENFSAKKMADGYEEIYKKILSGELKQ